MPAAIECAAWKMMIWAGAHLATRRACPIPLSGVRGQVQPVLNAPHLALAASALGAVAVVMAVRSAWSDSRGRRWR